MSDPTPRPLTRSEQKAALKKRHADESRRRHMGLMIVYEKP